jgi:hypothetical protein
MDNRPKGILILAIVMFFAAFMGFIVFISTFINGTPLDVIWTLNNSIPQDFKNSLLGKILGIFVFIIGIVALSAGWGLLKGLKWAWWITVIIFVLNGIGDVVRVVLGGFEGIVGILIALIILYYLTRPDVKAFFNK